VTAPGALAPGRTFDATWLLRASAIAALVLLRVVALAVVLDSGEAYERTSAFGYDTGRYHVIAEKPGVPYRDFEVEYPPGSLALIEVVHGPTKADTMQLTGVVMLLLDFVAAAGVAYGWGRRAAITYLALGLPMMFPPFIYFRVDLLSVALAIWGFALVKRRREVVGGALMGVAVLAKFWPLALLPVLLVRRQWRATTTMLSTLAMAGLAWVAWVGVDGPRQVVTFRGATGWNTESLIGGFYRIVDGGAIFTQMGAVRTGHVPGWASPLLGLVLVAGLGALWWRLSRGKPSDDGIVEGVAPVAAICLFLVCSPVLSPQYLVWLLPFGAICWVRGQRTTAWLVAASVVLTMLLTKTYSGFPGIDLGTYSLLTARNVVLVATIVVGFVTIERAARRDSSQSTFVGSDGAPLMSSIRSSATRADAAVRSSTTI
jgi:hypothetical protein